MSKKEIVNIHKRPGGVFEIETFEKPLRTQIAELEEENRVLKKRQNDFCDIVVSTIEVWLQQEGFYAEEFEDLFDLIRELKWNEN